MRIFTQRNIISSPPLKSIPNWTISPFLTGNGLLSVPGELSLTWFKNVPDELFTSLMNHSPSWAQNSQCLRLTTLDLKPTGAAVDRFAGWLGCVSRSEYLPTRIISFPVGSVRPIGLNINDGLGARASWCWENLIVGLLSGPCKDPDGGGEPWRCGSAPPFICEISDPASRMATLPDCVRAMGVSSRLPPSWR